MACQQAVEAAIARVKTRSLSMQWWLKMVIAQHQLWRRRAVHGTTAVVAAITAADAADTAAATTPAAIITL